MLRAIARSLIFPRSSGASSQLEPTLATDTDPPRKRKHVTRAQRNRVDSNGASPEPVIAVNNNPQTTSAIDSTVAGPFKFYNNNPDHLLTCQASPNPDSSLHIDFDNYRLNPASNLRTQSQQHPGLPEYFCLTQSPSLQNTAEELSEPKVTSLPLTPALRLQDNDIEIAMLRKVWVKRPGASATRVEVREDDLVDNVRDVILQKYANSLGRSIDSPDVTLKIVSREQANTNVPVERILSPEEPVGRTLDTYYPGGQTIDDALLIEVPQRRTPRPSPRPGNHLVYYGQEEYRPGDTAREYFPPMPLHSPRLAHVQHQTLPNGVQLPVHSMSVLTTGQVPPLPSPGGHGTRRHIRPKYGRQHTSSPTIIHSSQPQHPNGLDNKPQMNGVAPQAPPLPTPPPIPDHKNTITPPNRTTSPYPNRAKKKKTLNTAPSLNGDLPLPSKPASASLLDGRVPPINVLIVEDNNINMKLLEQFMRKLKVRWKTAVNGREAVDKWRVGGFHLVLMDIQLPIMSGLEATKEIRRLEGANGIGLSIFGDASPNEQRSEIGQLKPEDKLNDRDLFKSPVIIVALTASSLQSDRHEALAVGCNDFLTKPVNFGWMERKVTEWGCMQALIDFDGWRKWKEIEAKNEEIDPEIRKQAEKDEKAKAKAALRAAMSRPPPTSLNRPSNAGVEQSGTNVPNGNRNIVTSPTTDMNMSNSLNTGRRTHKNSRSSGSLGTTLPSTMEEDEKS